ncbi:hypothetical protein NEOLEDRAFT_1109090 [Neolentinus lepideus HHB14362 ss-1]|uniref:Zn(2)-C6 fungal-type domain-containing protein n=1 Tax=Neolentinus lepideus HHB14362 ss-1 TaxID=1314782 RepID=A0A165UJF5_9AGAM|nr:hypothetical protein NEOLEDRAFT_1109090 [Neolentinus lepideus HHB14362 ss-1]
METSHSPAKPMAAAANGGAQPPAMQQSNNSSVPSGSQLRSRITVVCAECKRLKLKCDRRTPCGSCTKRDCIEKCIYSPAAAEKIDVQSLHNRLLITEAHLSQIMSGRIPIPHSISSSSSLPSYNDRALLAVGNSGSSVVISLEDVAGLWLEELDIGADGLHHHSSPPHPYSDSSPGHQQVCVKLEPTPPTLPALVPSASSSSSSMSSIFLSLPAPQSYFRQHQPSPDAPPAPDALPTVTPAIFSHLPAHPRVRELLLDKCEHLLQLHPSFNWFHFRRRVRSLFDMSLSTGIDKAIAREILFGTPSARQVSHAPEPPKPTLSFFAAVAAALALGALVWKEEEFEGLDALLQPREMVLDTDDAESLGEAAGRRRKAKASKTSMASGQRKEVQPPDPAALYALSQQALGVFEMFHSHDLDFLVAMDLQVLFLLHDGVPNISSVVFPMVGKMVNVARAMGLAMDPDEFPNKYSLFEAETRRRIWWDVFYYDLFVSDCMGHPPLIADNSHTTKIPVSDVDEERFVPESVDIPTLKDEDHGEHSVGSSTYLVLKCRLAQLVKSVKKRSFRDPLADSSSSAMALEQVAGFEAEVSAWLKATPRAYHVDMSVELCDSNVSSPLSPGSVSTTPSESPYLVAQRCELSIITHRLLLKLFVPFLRSRLHGDVSARSPQWQQASLGTMNAAHNIVQACRALHTVWRQNKRPAAFVFYSFGRTLFDAAVCLAHAVIQQSTAIWTKAAMDDVKQALEILKDPKVATGRGPVNGGVEGSVSEAVTIVETMFRKAQQAMKFNSAGSGSHAGVKRKHEDVDVDHTLTPGFRLPYLGAGVQVSKVIHSPEPVASSTVPVYPRSSSSSSSRRRNSSAVPPAVLNSKTSTPDPESDHRKSSKSGKVRHPSVGIRMRTGKEGPSFNKARHDRISASPSNLVIREYSPPGPRVMAFDLGSVSDTGYTSETPIYVDATDEKDFDMSFTGNAETDVDPIDKTLSSAQEHSREQSGPDRYANGMQGAPPFEQMPGSTYGSFASSPAYSSEPPSSGRSDQTQPFSAATPMQVYPQTAPSPFPSGSSHGIPHQTAPQSYSASGYNALVPQNPYPPVYSSPSASTSASSYSQDPRHMQIMSSSLNSQLQSDMRPPPIPATQAYSVQHTKSMHNSAVQYISGHGSNQMALPQPQSQPMAEAQAWPPNSTMGAHGEYWEQSYDMKLSDYQ